MALGAELACAMAEKEKELAEAKEALQQAEQDKLVMQRLEAERLRAEQEQEAVRRAAKRKCSVCFEDVMEGGIDVLLAYKANQRIQQASQ